MSPSILFLCMGGVGHVQVLMPLIDGLHARGCRVRVMTREEFRPRIETSGAEFVDLYAEHRLEAADAKSVPIPSRFVTFAAVYAGALAKEIAAWAPELVVYDTFTVVAPVVARLLGVPFVNVCPNHAPVPSRVIADLRADPRVATADECWAAVERLRRDHGLRDASPFSYVDALSPFLNVYCEPPEFLKEEDRAAFQPIVFSSSLMPPGGSRRREAPRRSRRLVYASFGTGVWRYFEAAARAALESIARAAPGLDVEVTVSLGGHPLGPEARAGLEASNVRVADYVDQHAVLEAADAFVTHHGLNSTHESIFHEVPMLSRPFFGDQPALANRCQELGLAVPLAASPRAAFDAGEFEGALARLSRDRERFAARLAEARSWELRTIANRGAVLDRMLALIGTA